MVRFHVFEKGSVMKVPYLLKLMLGIFILLGVVNACVAPTHIQTIQTSYHNERLEEGGDGGAEGGADM